VCRWYLPERFKHPLLALPLNPLNPKLNIISHLLAILGAHRILHVSRIRVKSVITVSPLGENIIYVLIKPLTLNFVSVGTDIQVVSLIILQDCKKSVAVIDEWSDRRPFFIN
jgi:hypothetical protein